MFLFSKNQSIDGYTVVFPHKEGRYAQTYRIKDQQGKVKFLKLIFMEKLEVFQYDRDGQVIEVEAAQMLSHDNLCRFVDKGSLEKDAHQLLYFVTDYMRSEQLNDRLYRGVNLTSDDIREIMIALLSAVKSLHSLERPLIHNEITTENILLDMAGNYEDLKLIDLGAARFADLKPDPSSWHNQNLYYVAPERLFGDGDFRSDLFSAGVVLYRLLFNMFPWEADLAGRTKQEQAQILTEKRNGPLTLPNVQQAGIDEKLISIMLKALMPDPSRRFQSAEEFIEALEGKIEVEGISFVTDETGMMQQQPAPVRLKPKEGNGFADVAGMNEIKTIMQKKIINILKDPQKAEKFKIQIPNGMLLFGPPGCGKSFIAEKFAEEAGYNYVFIKSSDLASIYVHGSQEKIGKLFDEARKNAPTIINFDEFEALVPNRSKINNSSESGEVNEFLSQMNNCGKDRVFIIASSNRPDLIDPAVCRKGRLDQIIYIPVPDKEARKGMFEIHMKDRPTAGDIDYEHLADMTENFVASDIAFIVNDAATKAFEDDIDITQQLIEEVIKENKPSVSSKDIAFYEDMRRKFDSNSKEPERRKIGFS